MLSTKPPKTPQSQILPPQLHRLQSLLALTSPTTTSIPPPTLQFILGYISAYTSPTCHTTHRPFTQHQWKELKDSIQIVLDCGEAGLIGAEAVLEIFVMAVWYQVRRDGNGDGIGMEGEEKRRDGPKGIDIVNLRKGIQYYLNSVTTNPHYMDDIFGKDDVKVEKKSSLKDKSQPSILKLKPKLSTSAFQPKPKQEEIMVQSNKLPSQQNQNQNLGIECPICLSQITLSTVCPVSCGHILHKSCLIQHFKSKVQVKSFPITCPEQGCLSEIVIQDLQEYIPKELLQKYYEFSMHQFVNKNRKNTNWCLTAGCSAVFVVQGMLLEYQCPSCKKSYCLKCKTESHEKITCEQNQQIQNLSEQDKQFMKFAEGTKMKQCPSCKFWVEKNKGCDHMTCRCTYEFCFRCGAKYGECTCDQADSYYGDDDDDDDEDGHDVEGEGENSWLQGNDFDQEQSEDPSRVHRETVFIRPARLIQAERPVQRLRRIIIEGPRPIRSSMSSEQDQGQLDMEDRYTFSKHDFRR